MAEDPGPWGRAQAEARAQADLQPPPAPAEPRGLPVGLFIWLGLLGVAGIGFCLMAYLMPAKLGPSGWGDALADFGMLALVSAGLVRLRGVDAGRAARHATIWVAIVGVMALGYAYREDIQDFGQRLQAELFPDNAAVTPRALVIRADADGQFAVNGLVNGHPVRFVVDTGSSDVVLSPEDAQAAGVDLSTLNFHRMFATANGGGSGADYVAPSLEIGPIRLTNVHASINKAPIGVSLLGMSFLRRMDAVEINGDRMTLRWKG